MDPEPKYRLLRNHDTVQKGDELLLDDCETWEPVKGWPIGCAYNPAFYVPVRRAV